MIVGVVVERRKAASPWIDFTWRPVAILPGQPDALPWTVLSSEDETTTFYAGTAEIDLYRMEAPNYRDNLASGAPSVWVALRPTEGDPPYKIAAVTVDPYEGESYTEAGNDLVDAVPMPDMIRHLVAAFVAEHPIERQFTKRKRNRADPEALARRGVRREDGSE
ncbi:MAG: DUF3305 domain-containing protein [Xanthobacteraceae bacterium]